MFHKNLRKSSIITFVKIFPFGNQVQLNAFGTNVIMTNDDASIERERWSRICYKTGNIDDLVEKLKY